MSVIRHNRDEDGAVVIRDTPPVQHGSARALSAAGVAITGASGLRRGVVTGPFAARGRAA